jgi:hypothetical protein
MAQFDEKRGDKKIWWYYPFNLVRKSEKSADAHLWT